MKFLVNNIKYPEVARKAGIQGMVHINYIVEKDGSLSSIKVIRGIGSGCDEEALRVVSMMPKWKPGKQRGKIVAVEFNLPINFVLN
jgi:TonB family protein